MDNFFKRVAKAQTEIKAPKNQRNTFGNYNYRSCEDILEAAKPVCSANGLLLTVSDELVLIGDRYYVKATATLHDTESDMFLLNNAFAREAAEKRGQDDSQITGTASSYARKYALNGLFCIDDTKDADTDEYAKQSKREAPPAQSKPRETIEEVKARFDAGGHVCDKCGAAIVGYKGRDGKEVTPDKHIASTKKMFGMELCLACAKKMKEEKEN